MIQLIALIAIFLYWINQFFEYAFECFLSHIGKNEELLISIQNNQNQLLNHLNILKTPIFDVLSTKNEHKTHKDNQKQFFQYRFVGKLWSALVSIIFCIVLPYFFLHQHLTNFSFITFRSLRVIQILTNLGFSFKNNKVQVIYQNDLNDQIFICQIVSTLIYASLFIKKVKKIHQTEKSVEKSAFLLKEILHQSFQLLLKVLMILINPCLASLFLIDSLILVSDKQQLSRLGTDNTRYKIFRSFQLVKIIIFSFFLLFIWVQVHNQDSLLYENYSEILFPQSFSPQSNLVWIFYAHMFDRYLEMYQLILFSLPISTAFVLSLLGINYQTKILIQYLITIFMSYHCCYFQVYIFWFICLFCLPNFARYQSQILKKINKTLGGIIAFGGSTFFLFAYQRINQMYLSSWKVGIGYVVVFGFISWLLIAVWLVELLRIQLEEVSAVPYESDEKTIFQKLSSRLKKIFKFKFWIRNHSSQSKGPLKNQ